MTFSPSANPRQLTRQASKDTQLKPSLRRQYFDISSIIPRGRPYHTNDLTPPSVPLSWHLQNKPNLSQPYE
jgi:hypothetical protein